MAQMITAGGSLVNKLPIPKSIRIVVFNALKAKGNNFLRHEALPGHARTSRIEPLTAFTAKDDTPDFEVISTSKANPLGTARIESKVLLQDMEDCPQSFGEIGVSSGLEASLESMGIEQPTPVQTATIPIILEGKDTAVQCYTGSGKTLAYMIPVLMKALARAQDELDQDLPASEFGQLQALIVAPSRELAMQIVRVAKSLLPVEARQAVHQAIGGANYSRQVDAMREKPIIVIGTPGRLADHSRSGNLMTHKCPLLILDEVDQLMARHFTEDMRRITEHCGRRLPHRETILVSATLTEAVIERAGQWAPGANFTYVTSQTSTTPISQRSERTQDKPKWGWGGESPTVSSAGGVESKASRLSLPPNLKHGYIVAPASRKVDTLRRCIYGMDAQKVLVFMNFQQRLQDTVYKLAAKKMEVGSLHGEKTKLEREQTLKAFRKGMFRALVVSDVMARGLDVEDCDAVFNLEMPSDPAHYAHRAGRTGRMGRDGMVVSIVTISQVFVIEKIANHLGIEIDELEATGGELRMKGAFQRAKQ